MRVVAVAAVVLQMLVAAAAARLVWSRAAALQFAESPGWLGFAVVVLAATAAVKWVTVVAAALRAWGALAGWRRHLAALAVTFVAVAAAGVPLAGAVAVYSTRDALGDVFASGERTGPVASPATTTTTSAAPATSSVPRPGARPASSADLETTSTSTSTSVPLPARAALAGDDGRWNVLLLGGDAGPGRFGIRTDSIVVVSIDPVSGDVAAVSVPRGMSRVPFSDPALTERFPDGFSDLVNAIYQWGTRHPEANPAIGDDTERGAWAISSAVAELTGLRVDDWVLVDMAGFVDIVDAVGPIDVWVPRRVPAPGNPPGSKHPVPDYIEAGWQEMDGTVALAYARVRKIDSDFQRVERQRCVLLAAARELDAAGVALRYFDLLDAVSSSVRTSIRQSELSLLADLAGVLDVDAARAVSLAPPAVNQARPDVNSVRTLVAATVFGSPADNASESTPSAGSPGSVAPLPGLPSDAPTSTLPTSEVVFAGERVADVCSPAS